MASPYLHSPARWPCRGPPGVCPQRRPPGAACWGGPFSKRRGWRMEIIWNHDLTNKSIPEELSMSKNKHGALVKLDLRNRAKPAKYFVRACAVEMHMDISQGHFCARIYSGKAGGQRAYPDLTPAFYAYCKHPSVWTHCLGKKRFNHQKHSDLKSIR